MEKQLEAFIAKKKEKAEAKAKSLAAVGEARLAESEGRNADEAWAVVAEFGFAEGLEGKCHAELQQMADDYVSKNAGLYEFFERFIRPDGTPQEQEAAHDALVGLINTFRRAGDTESQIKAEMFELARFPRKNIGSQAHIEYRRIGG